MDPGFQPEVLSCLTIVEEQLIARIHVNVQVYKIKGQQTAYSGNVINFAQDVTSIANSLPHRVKDIPLIVVGKKSGVDNVHFRVSASRVRNALNYKQKNDPYYKQITINEEVLNELPEDKSVYAELQCLMTDVNDEIEVELTDDPTNVITSTHVPLVNPVSQDKQVSHAVGNEQIRIDWPEITSEPTDEFNSPGYIAMAFPTLFPNGIADLSDERGIKVTPNEYFQHLMLYKDGRFARHPYFRYFGMNTLMRWSSLKTGAMFVKKNDLSRATVGMLKEKIKQNPSFVKKVACQNGHIRGSKSYWYGRSGEVRSFLEQFGPAHLFFTLSAADLHWEDLYRVLTTENIADLSIRRKAELLNQNPLVANWYFKERVNFYISVILKKKFQISDYWYRFEWQHRGSPHVHGLLWIENGPDIRFLDQQSEAERQSTLEFFSSLVSTINPNVNEQPADEHPSRKKFSNVQDRETDLIQLINRVQRHNHSKGYCQRLNKTTKKVECRFKFPFELKNSTSLEKNEKGVWEMLTARNDPLINRYNPFILQSWRSNVDLSPILSMHSVLNYITKYATKGESGSDSFKSYLTSTLNDKFNDDDPAKKAVQSLFIKTCSDRDFSAQEVTHILMGYPLFHSSRDFVSLPMYENDWVRVQDQKDNESESSSLFESYPSRPKELEMMTLWLGAKTKRYYKYKGSYKWGNRQKDVVVRVFPIFILSNDDLKNESYYRQKVLLHVPWRKQDGFLERFSTWKDTYEYYGVSQIEGDLFGGIEVDEEEYELAEDSVHEMDEFMTVAGMGPNREFQQVELGNRDMDRHNDWSSSYTSYNHPELFSTFIKTSKGEVTTSARRPDRPNVELGLEQRKVIEHLKNQLNSFTDENLVIIHGKAGTGKSLCIKEMCSLIGESSRDDEEPRYKIVAPTGAASLNVDGETIHAAFKIPIKKRNFKQLEGRTLREFENTMQNVDYLIIDEFSMVGCQLLYMIEKRCCQGKSNNNVLFGGMKVYLIGDLNQLPTMGDTPLYSPNQNCSEFSNLGKIVYRSFSKCFFLTHCHRQVDGGSFLEALDNLSKGMTTTADYCKMKERMAVFVSRDELAEFQNAVKICFEKEPVKDHNIKKLEELNNPVAKILSKCNNNKATSASDDAAEGLAKVLYLSIGAKVMLRTNLWTSAGLVNGAVGTVSDIVYTPEKGPPNDMPCVIMVKFERYSGPNFESSDSVPICAIERSWYDNGVLCTRQQFPLCLSWAITAHKCQGLTLTRAIVQIGAKEFSSGLSYVAMSRVKTWDSLIFSNSFTLDRLQRIGQMRQTQYKQMEQERLRNL